LIGQKKNWNLKVRNVQISRDIQEDSSKRNIFPLVSIGIPTHNSNGKLLKALLSVWEQDYPNIEIIVSDNASTDNTEQLCAGLQENFVPIKYFRQPKNIGVVPNFDFVMKRASGEFFMWLCDDDTMEPGILVKYVDFLIQHPEYSLVSGQILYWMDDQSVFVEKNFSMEGQSASLRVVQFYTKVVHGAIYYGLMRTRVAQALPLRNQIANDWHFVAALAYLGKVKNLDCIGYNKSLGGLSKDFKKYAAMVKTSWFTTDFPRIQIAVDAFFEILFHSPAFSRAPLYSKFGIAVTSSVGILAKYYLTQFPFIIGGKVKRFFSGVLKVRELQKLKDHAPVQ
jgi:glycosyltransferase involved in cell wall biosynthesis